jgi:hypothetical protein
MYLRSRGATTTKPDDLKPFSFLAKDTSSNDAYAIMLTKCNDLAGILAVGTNGKVKLVHHFFYDMKTPFDPDGSNQLIMLTGRSIMENPIAADPAACLTIQADTDIRHPTWAQLATAVDGPAVSAIGVPRSGRERTGGLRPLLPIPAWLAATLMEANTDDAATLCTIAIQAIRNFNIRAMDSFVDAMEDEAVEETKDDTNPPPTDSAKHILSFVPIFLWAVAIKKITGCAYDMTESTSTIKWCSFVRHQCFGSHPTGTNPTDTPGLEPHSLDLRFGSVISRLERVVQLADERIKTDQTDKDQKAFKKLEPFTQDMILFASEPLETEDDNGNPTLVTRTQPVDSYAQLICLGNVAQAKLHLDNVIMVKHKCPVSLPIATVNAIINGRFTWSDHSSPEAFSIFACFKPGPSTISTDSDDFLALQLKSSEGQGLSDADVARSTKVTLRIPNNEHQQGNLWARLPSSSPSSSAPTPPFAKSSEAGAPTSATTNYFTPNKCEPTALSAARSWPSSTGQSNSTSVLAWTKTIG